jgi:hypothetical protein
MAHSKMCGVTPAVLLAGVFGLGACAVYDETPSQGHAGAAAMMAIAGGGGGGAGGGGGSAEQLSLAGLAGAAGADGEGAPPENPGDQIIKSGKLPSDIEDRFAGSTPVMDATSPVLLYPTPETLFPRDLARLTLQWVAPIGQWFHLQLAFPRTTLDVFTDGRHPDCQAAGLGAMCWESSSEDLAKYFAFEAGASFELKITALGPDGQARLSETASFRVSRKPALGVIYYWSTTAKGVRRGTLDGRVASDYLTPSTGLTAAEAQALTEPERDTRCVACHTLSRSGKRLMVSLPGDQLGVVGVSEIAPPPFTYASTSSGVYGNDPVVGASWAAFNPTEDRLIVAVNGRLSILDVSTPRQAPKLADVLLPELGGVPMFGSMPDWSPDGRQIAFTATAGDLKTARQSRHIRGSSIAVMSMAGDHASAFTLVAESQGVLDGSCQDGLNEAQTLIESGPGRESYANPMFSPDGKWLLYSHAECESERDPSARIVISKVAPNASQYTLPSANARVGGRDLTRLTNGMPTWGPRIDDGIAWVAFTSTRDYGGVIAPGSALLGQIGYPVRQLWIAAIDLNQIESGGDASYPAFRLPAQDYDENNHRPFWTVDVLPPDFVRQDPK